jgi:GT2 family glycosyltransferase/glycosyltransferase involved in cell wall biosynthesis
MWGTSWRQRLRLAPLHLALAAADGWSRAPWLRPPAQPGPWREGLSVVIPDRDAPAMLAEALASLFGALAAVDEPHQVIVVANGAKADVYADLRTRFGAVEWIQSDAPLGFAGAIQRGLAQVRHDWTYLMNNDMTLDPRTLSELLRWRGHDVFAVSSQIFQQNAAGRREETGFTDWYVDAAGLHLFHAGVPNVDGACPHLCASGGAALFRTAPLRRYVDDGRCYDPFYWEDVEWSLRAWRDGLSVLFCPRSRVDHRHRATTARFYDAAEIDRIVERNRLLFDLRHGITAKGRDWLMNRACDLPYQSQRELAPMRQALGVFRQRVRSRRPPQPGAPPLLPDAKMEGATLHSSYSFRLRADTGGQPARKRLLMVTPFAVFPPRHGGAHRVAGLLGTLRDRYDIVLVSDEASLYDGRSFSHLDGLYAVHLVQRERDARGAAGGTLVERMHSHCHPRLVAAVDAALRLHRPDLVQIEHAELAELVGRRSPGQRWILDLHDAYGQADFADAREATRFEVETLGGFDAIAVCSDEDRALVRHPRVVAVPNGSRIPLADYRPSTSRQLLFSGPFRYQPNRDGILRFLQLAYPAVRAAIPDVRLLVLGGDEALPIAAAQPAFAQPGVEVAGHRDDVPELLARSALTINPQTGIRGSSVKLIESLTAGRVCVSTADGARGFHDVGFAALVTVPDVEAMIEPIIRLLLDTDERHRLEAPPGERLAPYQWTQCAGALTSLYDELLRPR